AIIPDQHCRAIGETMRAEVGAQEKSGDRIDLDADEPRVRKARRRRQQEAPGAGAVTAPGAG
ncbi:MAG: hypothetical protein REJ50_19475, partial [Bordetella sp.]|nr:hypothetical protein [Bordetella sp.]